MAKKLSEQQILQYILQGGSPSDLEDAGVDMSQIIVTLVKNPEVLSGFRQQAETVGSALESLNIVTGKQIGRAHV